MGIESCETKNQSVYNLRYELTMVELKLLEIWEILGNNTNLPKENSQF